MPSETLDRGDAREPLTPPYTPAEEVVGMRWSGFASSAVFGPDYWLLPEASASEMAAAMRVSRPLMAAHLHLRIAGRRATTPAIWLAHIALNGLAAPDDRDLEDEAQS